MEGGPSRIGRRVTLSAAVGMALYVALSLYADLPAVRRSLASFPWPLLAGVCGLSLANYGIRFLKWEIYRDALGIPLARTSSLRVYLSGFAFSVTPGKMGEVVKSVLLKQESGVPISRSAPIVVAERLTDLVAYLALMAGAGLGTYPGARGLFVASFLLLAGLLLLVGSEGGERGCVRLASRIPLLERFVPKIGNAFRSTRILLAPRRLLIPTALSGLSWFCECAGFHLVARAFGASADLGLSTFVYAFSAVAGALSMLPGGLGVTEGSLGFLLDHEMGLERPSAAAATIVIRLGTLWFAVALGSAALALSLRRGRIRASPPPGVPPSVPSR